MVVFRKEDDMTFQMIYCGIALFMWSVSLLFSKEYFAHYSHKGRYYGFLIFTMFATLGVFLSKDLLTLFIFFELMSLSSYVWVAQEETEEALNVGKMYLAVAVIGGMVLLMGLFLLNNALGTLKIEELYEAVLQSDAGVVSAAVPDGLQGAGDDAGASRHEPGGHFEQRGLAGCGPVRPRHHSGWPAGGGQRPGVRQS